MIIKPKNKKPVQLDYLELTTFVCREILTDSNLTPQQHQDMITLINKSIFILQQTADNLAAITTDKLQGDLH